MRESAFYGRQEELDRLKRLLRKVTSSLIVVKGRRRIGKSRLIEEFSKEFKTYVFTGLPPEKNKNAQEQRDYFVKQLRELFGPETLETDHWWPILAYLAKKTSDGRIILVFDEINWIGSFDNTFLGQLKGAWDLLFKKNPELIFILSGSASNWIDKNILSSTGFMGRMSLELTLDELPLPACNLFWRKKAQQISAYEKFKILSVTGGVPRYLEEIDPNESAEKNIQTLAFTKGGLLVEEFDRIFSDLFSNRSARYKQIVSCLVESSATLDQICQAIDLEKGGVISSYLDDLVETGYITQDNTWNIKTSSSSNLCKFRLRDNYLRFYLRYIEPHRPQIENNRIKTPPSWASIMGLQFENLVLNNFHRTDALLNIEPDTIIYDSPYFQRATKSHAGCQIDLLIQTKFNTLYVCEIKFSKEPIGPGVIKEVQQKIEKLAIPKGFSVRPVLIHVNGVKDTVIESDYFSKIIDFSQFLED